VLLGGWRRLWLRTVVCVGGIDRVRVRKQVKKKKNDDAAATMGIVL